MRLLKDIKKTIGTLKAEVISRSQPLPKRRRRISRRKLYITNRLISRTTSPLILRSSEIENQEEISETEDLFIPSK